jgi:GNAT superfamily N-acetyltransferase
MSELKIKPLIPANWHDFEQLFGTKGAYGGCWCMWWRLSRKEFEKGHGEQNKAAMHAIVRGGTVPGIILYKDGQPAAWCSVAPREHYSALERSRLLKRRDDDPSWAIVCLFVDRKYRRQKLGLRLIEGAIQYVRDNGGSRIEAYPTIPRSRNVPPVSSYMGFPDLFRAAGFEEVAVVSPSRMIMEYRIR